MALTDPDPGAARVIDLTAPDLAWTPVSMPGAAGPVHLVRLHADPVTRASVSLVRFPPGWSRPGTGHYACAEEIVVLDGGIRVSGTDFEAGTYAYLPPRATRAATLAGDRGCLALAWFSGPPAWGEGPAADPPDHEPVHGPVRGPAGPRRERRATVPGEAAVLLAASPARPVAERGGGLAEPADLLFPDARRWAYVPAGEPFPGLPGPVLVRRWPVHSDLGPAEAAPQQ